MNISIEQFAEGLRRSALNLGETLSQLDTLPDSLIENYQEDITCSLNTAKYILLSSLNIKRELKRNIIESLLMFKKHRQKLLVLGIDFKFYEVIV